MATIIHYTATWAAADNGLATLHSMRIDMQRHGAGDGPGAGPLPSGPLPVFASESPSRATESQGALFAAHHAHLDLHYLDSPAQVPPPRPSPGLLPLST